jgi:hypothetical protein
LKKLQISILIILISISSSSSIDISNSINFTLGVPEIVDVKYGLQVSRVSLYIRPGVGWFFLYMINNEKSWKIFPEVSVAYRFFQKNNIEAGPEIGFAYIYHNGYYNHVGSSNYSAESKADMMFENIKAKFIWNSKKSRSVIAGNAGFSIIQNVNQSNIVENNVKRHTTDITGRGLFPILSFEFGYMF